MTKRKIPADPNILIQNCNFTSKIWDEQVTASIQDVARALLNMTELFKAQNIAVGPLLVFNSTPEGPTMKASAGLRKVHTARPAA